MKKTYLFFLLILFFISPKISWADKECFGGVGLAVSIENPCSRLLILDTIKGGPAEKVGIRTDDEILAINHASMKGKEFEDIVNELRGSVGSNVILQIYRSSEKRVFDQELTREEICYEEP